MTTQEEYNSVEAALYLEGREVIPQSELSDMVNYSQAYVSQALGDLDEAGAIRKEKNGRANIIHVEDYDLLVERQPELEEADLEEPEGSVSTSQHSDNSADNNVAPAKSIQEIMDQEITVGQQGGNGVEEVTELDNEVTSLASESGLETEREKRRFDGRT